ncbi:MAG: HAD family hydrolase [Phycisphaerales bacterium]
MHLLLFDIDATMLKSQRAGLRAMHAAGRELFGDTFEIDGIDFAGRLDPLILGDMLERNSLDASPANIHAMRGAYRRHLEPMLKAPGTAYALAGVLELLTLLRARHTESVLGVLTGNFPETGRLKLHAAGIDPSWFPVHAWGDDSPHTPPDREHLPPIATARAKSAGFGVTRTTIIGDTPHDVRCARAHGHRVLGVATGVHTTADLHAAGADRVVESLADASDIASWLLDASPLDKAHATRTPPRAAAT